MIVEFGTDFHRNPLLVWLGVCAVVFTFYWVARTPLEFTETTCRFKDWWLQDRLRGPKVPFGHCYIEDVGTIAAIIEGQTIPDRDSVVRVQIHKTLFGSRYVIPAIERP